ncbi:MAG: HAMP domain-containing protein [Chloroflexi bacterium]|nr:HAMP domain-containing protein [Chloroflexota bacterium]
MIGNRFSRVLRLVYPNINARIIGPFLLTVALVAGIGVYIVTRLVAGSLQERFNNQLLDSAHAATNSLADIEREQLATLRSMVFTEGVPLAVENRDADQLEVWLRPIATNARLDDMIVFDHSGKGILQLTLTDSIRLNYTVMPPTDVDTWDGVNDVLAQNVDVVGDKYVDIRLSGSAPLFYITAPVKDEHGQIVGGISIGMRMERLVGLISQQSLSAVALYGTDGTILGSTFRSVSAVDLTLTQTRVQELTRSTNAFTPIEDQNLQGLPYQVMYAPLEIRSQQVGLIVVGLPTNFIVERISTSRNWFGILFAGLFLGIGILGLVVARTIIHPVRRLVDTTRAIRDGDLSRRVGLRTPDELGELALSFDHMTTQLVQRNAEVEVLYHQQVEQTAQREAMLTSIGDAVVVQDPSGNILLRNGAADNLYTIARQDQKARQLLDMIHRSPEAFQSPRSIDLDESHFSVLAKPVCLNSGVVLGHVIVFRDVTALIASERLKDEMLLQMSHELRTPLTAARGFADLVRLIDGKVMSEQGQGFIGKVTEHLVILEHMINQAVDVSSILANRFELRIEALSLAELIRSGAEQWDTLAHKRDVSLSVSLPGDNELWIEGDKRYLSQVLDHLVRNACSYTLSGGSVEICAAPQDKCVHIYVIDNGVGIPPEELGYVFERMYRGQSAEAGPTDSRGLGLGLYLSKHIIEAHRGTIHLDSKVNYGTVVSIDLPVSQNDVIRKTLKSQ